MARKLGQSGLPPPSRVLSTTLCQRLLDCFQERSLHLPLVHSPREAKPASRQQDSGVEGGSSLTYPMRHALHLQAKTRGSEVLQASRLEKAEQGGQSMTFSFLFFIGFIAVTRGLPKSYRFQGHNSIYRTPSVCCTACDQSLLNPCLGYCLLMQSHGTWLGLLEV